MTIKVITLPATSGKTTWVINQVRQSGVGLGSQPRVILPSRQQVWDFEARLANAGGMIGVKLGTIVDLAREVLTLGGRYPLYLSEPVQAKVLREILSGLDLSYYRSIASKPGFVQSCLTIIREFKAGGISPEAFLRAAKGIQKGARLTELGHIYAAYSNKLRENDWVDRADLVWQASDLLAEQADLCGDWGNVYLDGFDDLTPIQIRLVSTLALRVESFFLTLTGTLDSSRRELVHKRFLRLREQIAAAELEDLAVPPGEPYQADSPAAALERRLFDYSDQAAVHSGGGIRLEAVPDRESEVRTALRWIRNKILAEKVPPSRTAILVRDLGPYRGLISRIAGEYDLPVRLQGGMPLGENPLISTLMKLAKLISEGKDGLAWHEVLAVWRSPYLTWRLPADPSSGWSDQSVQSADAKQLEEAVRWGKIIQGYSQWAEVFALLIVEKESPEDRERGGKDSPAGLPRGKQAEQLWYKFEQFFALISPPAELASRGKHIAWFENLLGGFEAEDSMPGGLCILDGIQAGPTGAASRDWLALEGLNRIFRDLIWAERLLENPPVDFHQFYSELQEIVNQTSYQPIERDEEAVACAGIAEFRGLHFQAGAILGLAEGDFPGTIKEDPFLRDEERRLLNERFGLPLRLSVDSAEGEYFYEALTRSIGDLLVTRPRVADNGAVWQPSPYWEELLRITAVEPGVYTARSQLPPQLAANQVELLQLVCGGKEIPGEIIANAPEGMLARLLKLERARDVIRARSLLGESEGSRYDGNLSSRSDWICALYPENYVWSASRLESYQTCPFHYFIGYLLGLEKLELPAEGLDARQRGTIYHRILENLYQSAGEDAPLDGLLQGLPEAAEPIFLAAPGEEGFRVTAWWKHTQQEILSNLKLALIRLENIDPCYRFLMAERRFGMGADGEDPVPIPVAGQGRLLLRGYIDRVDINQSGEIRVIDYKTSGTAGYDNRAVREGRKLQLPLYALAAGEGLKIGPVKEGFYFHLQAAEPSPLRLSTYRDGASRGPEAAMSKAAEMAWGAVASIKEGSFSPRPPEDGCPDYCPAADFCWQYRPGRW